jgi:hypothetical protein
LVKKRDPDAAIEAYEQAITSAEEIRDAGKRRRSRAALLENGLAGSRARLECGSSRKF